MMKFVVWFALLDGAMKGVADAFRKDKPSEASLHTRDDIYIAALESKGYHVYDHPVKAAWYDQPRWILPGGFAIALVLYGLSNIL